jgi:hypothetical protein
LSNFEKLRDENIYANTKAYKREIKEFIYDFSKDADYLNNKGKVGSWKSNSRFCYAPKAIPVLTDAGLKLFTKDNAPKECGSCYQKLKLVVGESFRKESM